MNLPARVYLPLSIGASERGSGMDDDNNSCNHHVVRIPPSEAVILKSKERVPYLMYVEVIDCENCQLSPLPPKHQALPTQMRRASVDDALSMARAPAPSVAEKAEYNGETDFRAADVRRSLESSYQRSEFGCADDPSAKAVKEPWDRKLDRIRAQSPYGHLANWRLMPVIIKCGDDLRQELLASQLMTALAKAWRDEKLALWLRPIRVLVTAHDCGMIEVVGSAVSLSQAYAQSTSLLAYFKQEYGGIRTEAFLTAQKNFVESLAAYSLFCYFTQVKDRHNGNILLDAEGHILHIDFGFMLSSSPRNLGFETAPFKLIHEYIEIMEGLDSDMFTYFKMLILQGYMAARKHHEGICMLLEIMARDSTLPCFAGGPDVVKAFRDRFVLGIPEKQVADHVDSLIKLSLTNMRTRLYDTLQYYSNGIMS